MSAHQEDDTFQNLVEEEDLEAFTELSTLDPDSATDSLSENEYQEPNDVVAGIAQSQSDQVAQEPVNQELGVQEHKHRKDIVRPNDLELQLDPTGPVCEAEEMQNSKASALEKHKFIIKLEDGTQPRIIDQKLLATVSILFRNAVNDCKTTSEATTIEMKIGTAATWNIIQSWLEQKEDELKALDLSDNQDEIDDILRDVYLKDYVDASLPGYKTDRDETPGSWIRATGLIEAPKSYLLEIISEVYLVAEFIELETLMNAAMDLIRGYLIDHVRLEGIPLYYMNKLWSETDYDCPLRRVFLDMLFSEISLKTIAEAVECGALGSKVSAQLLLEIWRLRN